MTLNEFANEVDIASIFAIAVVIMTVVCVIAFIVTKANMAAATVESMENARLVSRRSAPCPGNPQLMITRLIFEDASGKRVDLIFNEKGDYVPVEGDVGTVYYKKNTFVNFERS